MALEGRLRRVADVLFPEQKIYARELPVSSQLALFLLLVVVFSIAGALLPPSDPIAFDWLHVISIGRLAPFYPPWTQPFLSLLTWPLFLGLSMAGIALATLKRSVHPVSAVAALIALPTAWTLFLGQMEGLIVLGLLGLPWLTPLALLKPQVSAFAFAARRSYLVGLAVWLLVSVVAWGFWPARTLSVNAFHAEGRYVQDIALGWGGIVLAVPLLWLSRGDLDMLMIAGSFVTPYLIPYNMLPFTPAVARLGPGPALIAAVLSWLPFSANWLGDGGWWLGWLFVAWLWGCLAVRRYGAFRRAAGRASHPAGEPV